MQGGHTDQIAVQLHYGLWRERGTQCYSQSHTHRDTIIAQRLMIIWYSGAPSSHPIHVMLR